MYFSSNLMKDTLAQVPTYTFLYFQVQKLFPPAPNFNLRLPISHSNKYFLLSFFRQSPVIFSKAGVLWFILSQPKGQHFFPSKYYRKKLKSSASCQFLYGEVAQTHIRKSKTSVPILGHTNSCTKGSTCRKAMSWLVWVDLICFLFCCCLFDLQVPSQGTSAKHRTLGHSNLS